MDPYLYTAGMRGEGFKIDDISDLDEYARVAEEMKIVETNTKSKISNWVAKIIARLGYIENHD